MKNNTKANVNSNPFTTAKESLAPAKIQEIIDSGKLDAQINYRAVCTNGRMESHMYMYSSLIQEKYESSCKINITSKGIEITADGKEIKIPMKLIWGLISIITSILDVCEKVMDLIVSFGIRLESQFEKFVNEFKSSVTINGTTLRDIQNESESHKPSHQVESVFVTRRGHGYQFHKDSNADLRGCLISVLSGRNAEYGWYTVKVDGKKSFRFLYSSK